MFARFAAQWRSKPVCFGFWLPHLAVASPAPGEAGGMLFRCDADDIVAWLKPTKKDEGHYRAAHEKIASDLAFDLNLPLPPVVLHRRLHAPLSEETCVALSAMPRGTCHFEWRQLFSWGLSEEDDDLTGGIEHAAPRAWASELLGVNSGIVAFDAWLENVDRNNGRNAIVAFTGNAAPRLLFLDYANAFGHSPEWDNNGYQAFGPIRLPRFFLNSLDRERVIEVARAIEAMPHEQVSEIIRRVPDDFMHPIARATLEERLLWRKTRLVASLDHWYPSR